MADLDELRKLRGASKRKTISLIRKLTVSLQYGDDNSLDLKVELEREFDVLFDLELQINNDTPSDFLAETQEAYEKVLGLYHNSLKENEIINKQKKAIPIKGNIERHINEMKQVMDRLKEGISESTDQTEKKTDVPKIQIIIRI